MPFGNVLRDQRVGFGNRVIGAALENPDFMLLAKPSASRAIASPRRPRWRRF